MTRVEGSISVASEGRVSPKTEISFPHEPHSLFFVIDHDGKDIIMIHATIMLFQENKISRKKLFGYIYFKYNAWRL